MSLAELNSFLADKFPEVFATLGGQGRDPRYRYYEHKKIRYCWNTEPMPKGRPYATWQERIIKVSKDRWRMKRYQMSFFARRKVAKHRAWQRWEAAKTRTANKVKPARPTI